MDLGIESTMLCRRTPTSQYAQHPIISPPLLPMSAFLVCLLINGELHLPWIAGYMVPESEYWVHPNASFTVHIPYAEFRTRSPPDSLSKVTYMSKELGDSNCTTTTIFSSGSNKIEQYLPFTIEFNFYDGRRFWFEIPLSLNYTGLYSRTDVTTIYRNCPACPPRTSL